MCTMVVERLARWVLILVRVAAMAEGHDKAAVKDDREDVEEVRRRTHGHNTEY